MLGPIYPRLWMPITACPPDVAAGDRVVEADHAVSRTEAIDAVEGYSGYYSRDANTTYRWDGTIVGYGNSSGP